MGFRASCTKKNPPGAMPGGFRRAGALLVAVAYAACASSAVFAT